jgi:Family of unknown function (DUF5995)
MVAAAVPRPGPPATSLEEVLARMQSIGSVLMPRDGVACFDRMYLEVTEAVRSNIQQGSFADPTWVSRLDVVFANLYFAAVDAMSGPPTAMPPAWQPLMAARANSGIEPIQFALAGMNAHINHDLPLAVVATCTELGTAPADGSHRADYQKVDALLDAAEQSVRESFEPSDVSGIDRHLAAVVNLLADWSITGARDVAWDTAVALWEIRGNRLATDLLVGALGRSVAMASRCLLVAV